MGPRSSRTFRKRSAWVAAAAFGLGLFSVAATAQQPAPGPTVGRQENGASDAAPFRLAIERALATAPRTLARLQSPAQTGVRLNAVSVERASGGAARITIDLSQRALTYEPSGNVEAILDHVLASTAALTAAFGSVEYRILVDGLPLDQLVPRAPSDSRVSSRQVGAPARVVVSAGHGWYREASGRWLLQRDYYWGIVEDFVNHEMVRQLEAELRTARFDVRPARHPDVSADGGVSGYPRWQESAKYYVQDLGAPASVWDVGVDDYAKDINSRPFYANWIDSAVLVSIHNNGGGGTGTETWYDTTHAYHEESRRLAQIVNRRIVSAIREHYNPAWPDRGLRSCNGCKGETRLAARPAILVEVAFMDQRSPDNDALKDARFHEIVARAVREGLEEWGLRPPSDVGDLDSIARADLLARAARDPRFGAALDGSGGVDHKWDAHFELRWLDFTFSANRQVRLYHAVRRDDGRRFLGFWDPDSGAWVGWEGA